MSRSAGVATVTLGGGGAAYLLLSPQPAMANAATSRRIAEADAAGFMIETLPGHRRLPNLRWCAVEQAQSGGATPRAAGQIVSMQYDPFNCGRRDEPRNSPQSSFVTVNKRRQFAVASRSNEQWRRPGRQ